MNEGRKERKERKERKGKEGRNEGMKERKGKDRKEDGWHHLCCPIPEHIQWNFLVNQDAERQTVDTSDAPGRRAPARTRLATVTFDSDVPEQYWEAGGIFSVCISNHSVGGMHIDVLKVLATEDPPSDLEPGMGQGS